MTEQLLDDPQVRAALEEMRRERVAQRVRADPVAEPGIACRRFHGRPRLLAREPPAAVADEQRAAAWRRHVRDGEQPRPGLRQPPPEPIEGDVADWNEPLPIAL